VTDSLSNTSNYRTKGLRHYHANGQNHAYRTLQTQDISDPRHFGPRSEVSRDISDPDPKSHHKQCMIVIVSALCPGGLPINFFRCNYTKSIKNLNLRHIQLLLLTLFMML